MSQSETYVPGMNSIGGQRMSNDLYSRPFSSPSAPQTAGGTFVEGVSGEIPVEQNHSVVGTAEPVVGFLYSISRMGIGEYWPLHLGANTIGRSSKCSVQLKELSVSDAHATLNVKVMKSSQKLIASVRDTGSKNGMYLNDEELDYDNHACKDGDVLTIGSCYKLLVILINAKEYNLSVADNFVPYEDKVEETPQIEQYHRSSNYDDGGTVDLSGNRNYDPAGGTKIM